MLKTIAVTTALTCASTAFASHPHQAVCVISETPPSGNLVEFVLLIESAREYKVGDPDKDVHDWRYQVRICDDDNDTPSCSTYESKAVTHDPADEVTLVSMKDKSAVFFKGKIGSGMDGKIVKRDGAKRSLVPFVAKLDKCIAQSWPKLVPEADSHAH